MTLSPHRRMKSTRTMMTEYARMQLKEFSQAYYSHDVQEQQQLIALWTERVLCEHVSIFTQPHNGGTKYFCPRCGFVLLEEQSND